MIAARPLLVLTALLTVQTARAQPAGSSDAFVRWGAEHLVRLSIAEGDPRAVDLRPIRDMIGSAKVVLLGEPTHGAQEPLALRNRLFRELVDGSGFTAIALETGAPESAELQSYIDGGPGEVSAIARKHFTWGFGAFRQNVELLDWMREYNRTASPAHRLRIYGIDLSGSDDMADADRVERALAWPRAWLQRWDASASGRVDPPLAASLTNLRRDTYKLSAASERDALTSRIADLIAELERQRASVREATDARDIARALRDAHVGRQLDAFWRSMPAPDTPADEAARLVFRPITTRDGAMAENVRWAVAQEGDRGRVLAFSHTAHVLGSAPTGGAYRAFITAPSMMGRYLRASFDRDLFIIGSLAGFGPPGAKERSDSLGVEAALERMSSGPFALSLQSASAALTVREWLRSKHSIQLNSSFLLDVAPGEAFDALVYLGVLTRAHR